MVNGFLNGFLSGKWFFMWFFKSIVTVIRLNTGYPIKILHKAVIEGIFDLTDINIKHL